MLFQIHALPYAPFAPFFGMDAAALLTRDARAVTADCTPGYPCRVSLRDATPGERLVLVNHTHLDAASPYAARHAIYVREDAEQARPAPGAVPGMLRSRTLSLRAFDGGAMMREARVVDGTVLDAALQRMLEDGEVAEVHIHFAAPGCYAARVTRAGAHS